MLIKAEECRHSIHLGQYLIDSPKNETSYISGQRGIFTQLSEKPAPHEMNSAMNELNFMANASRKTKNHIFHVMLNPRQDEATAMTLAEQRKAWGIYEQTLGLEEQPFVEATQIYQNRKHWHRVYLRVTEEGKAVDTSFFYKRNELAARLIEFENGHSPVKGKHNRFVIKQLEEQGRADVAAWMRKHNLHQGDPAEAQYTKKDQKQAERLGLSVQDVQAALLEGWSQSDTAQAFVAAMAEKDYRIVQGDKTITVIDSAGGTHSLRRRLGMKAAIISERFKDFQLPNIQEVKMKDRRTGDRRQQPRNEETAEQLAPAPKPTRRRKQDNDRKQPAKAKKPATEEKPKAGTRRKPRRTPTPAKPQADTAPKQSPTPKPQPEKKPQKTLSDFLPGLTLERKAELRGMVKAELQRANGPAFWQNKYAEFSAAAKEELQTYEERVRAETAVKIQQAKDKHLARLRDQVRPLREQRDDIRAETTQKQTEEYHRFLRADRNRFSRLHFALKNRVFSRDYMRDARVRTAVMEAKMDADKKQATRQVDTNIYRTKQQHFSACHAEIVKIRAAEREQLMQKPLLKLQIEAQEQQLAKKLGLNAAQTRKAAQSAPMGQPQPKTALEASQGRLKALHQQTVQAAKTTNDNTRPRITIDPAAQARAAQQRQTQANAPTHRRGYTPKP